MAQELEEGYAQRQGLFVKASEGNSVTDCEQYRKILSMGRAALPLIRLAYDRREPGNLALAIVQGHGLVWLVQEIAGSDFSVPESIQGMICAVEDYTKRWLDENLGRYAGAPKA